MQAPSVLAEVDPRRELKPTRPDADLARKGVRARMMPESELRPRYPMGARLRGEEGTVTVSATVSDRGRAEQVSVVKTSGYPALDRAALDAVRESRFVRYGGEPGEGGEVVLTFRFRLVD
jgi:protein TonB